MKIKVFSFVLNNGLRNLENKIEKDMNSFMPNKEIVDIKVTNFNCLHSNDQKN